MPFGLFDPTYLMVLPALAFSFWAQFKVKSTYARWSQVPATRGLEGKDIARTILDRNTLGQVAVQPVEGQLTDHYDPGKKTVNLSEEIYHSRSVAALSVAAHECGHAIQDKEAYGPMGFRHAFVPVANIGSSAAFPIFIIGFLFQRGMGWLMDVGILLFSGVLVFHLVTLPVEFNASKRAMEQLDQGGYLGPQETRGAREVLNAAALTYVAATAMAAFQVIRLLVLRNSRD
jgi:uncharacterized protein